MVRESNCIELFEFTTPFGGETLITLLSIPVFKSILMNAPICLVWVIGLGMAWVQRHEQPKVSALVAIALLLLLVNTVLGTYMDLWMPVMLDRYIEQLPRWLGHVLILNEPVQLAIQTVAWTLLLFATFNWRTTHW